MAGRLAWPEYYVEVTNNNDTALDDHYDGQRYEFPPGKKVKIPFDAACHIFGIEHPDELKDKDKLLTFISRRWGWNTKEMLATKDHVKNFEKIKIVLVAYKVVRDDGLEEDAGLLPPSRAMSEDDGDEVVEAPKKVTRWPKKGKKLEAA